jgi:deoxyribodipyrimidine photolyase-related protein
MIKKAAVIFPNQLFETNFETFNGSEIFIIEEFLFFKQFSFHKQKLVFHRASMKSHEAFINSKTSTKITYIDAQNVLSDVIEFVSYLIKNNYQELIFIDPTDNWLSKRIYSFTGKIKLTELTSPSFLNTKIENAEFFASKKRMYQTDFYVSQRKKFKVLIDEANQPTGGKWSFDEDNRKKYPAKQKPPITYFAAQNEFQTEAEEYVKTNFNNNLGQINRDFSYPIDYASARMWLNDFLKTRFNEFGIYEDSIVKNEYLINHSLLSPLINSGLLNPAEVIETAIDYHQKNNIPLNSTEGFVRQIIGWREFIRAVYELKGCQERTTNFWKFKRKIPKSFYDGTTGIEPIDQTIKKTLETGYCHHIERLMILGNFMLICEFDPDEVYRWFMELFIDAYDWVMVPNVYGMSQFADGGLMSTKPYFSGSNYIMKMSDYTKGPWQEIWDALFWRFMHVQRVFFKKNPRLNMLISAFDKMDEEKQSILLNKANGFLQNLDK